jgi:hypothetical protein
VKRSVSHPLGKREKGAFFAHLHPSELLTKRKRPSGGYRPAPLASLPPERQPLDGTVQQVMAFRLESARTVWRKITTGTYKSYKNGDARMIEWASVLADREASIALGPQLAEPPKTGKRSRGRPKKAAAKRASDSAPAAE